MNRKLRAWLGRLWNKLRRRNETAFRGGVSTPG